MMYRDISEKGFTLIEIITYTGLFSVFLLSVLVSVFHILVSVQGATRQQELQSDITFFVDKLRFVGRGSTAISTTQSTITFHRPDLDGQSPVQVAIAENGKVLITYGESPSVELMPNFKVSTGDGPGFMFDTLHRMVRIAVVVDGARISRELWVP